MKKIKGKSQLDLLKRLEDNLRYLAEKMPLRFKINDDNHTFKFYVSIDGYFLNLIALSVVKKEIHVTADPSREYSTALGFIFNKAFNIPMEVSHYFVKGVESNDWCYHPGAWYLKYGVKGLEVLEAKTEFMAHIEALCIRVETYKEQKEKKEKQDDKK